MLGKHRLPPGPGSRSRGGQGNGRVTVGRTLGRGRLVLAVPFGRLAEAVARVGAESPPACSRVLALAVGEARREPRQHVSFPRCAQGPL